jgi:DNA-binding CsgD family transcriptional regulator
MSSGTVGSGEQPAQPAVSGLTLRATAVSDTPPNAPEGTRAEADAHVRVLSSQLSTRLAQLDDGHHGDTLLDLVVDDVRIVVQRMRVTSRGGQPALSSREREIARMVARGYSNKEIAGVLEISSWTVSTHLRRIFAKLGVTTRAAMVARLLGDEHRSVT